VDSGEVFSDLDWLEEGFWASESLVSDGDGLTIRHFIDLVSLGGLGESLNFLVKVKGDVAELLLDVSNDFSFSGGGEGLSQFGH